MRIRSLRSIVMLVVLATLAFPTLTLAQGNPGVLSLESTPLGNSYGDWSAIWWQWALSLPATSHPLFDTADCGTGQSGPVFFLGGRFCATPLPGGPNCNPSVINRSCTVPAGKALFFPILNVEDSVAEELAGFGLGDATPAGLRNLATIIAEGIVDVAVTVDGHPIKGGDGLRVQSPLFSFALAPHDNLFAAIGETGIPDGTTSLAVADGVYVMLAPLSAGLHTLHFSGVNTCPFCNNFPIDATYHLIVK
jgi:hypothetical protein